MPTYNLIILFKKRKLIILIARSTLTKFDPMDIKIEIDPTTLFLSYKYLLPRTLYGKKVSRRHREEI